MTRKYVRVKVMTCISRQVSFRRSRLYCECPQRLVYVKRPTACLHLGYKHQSLSNFYFCAKNLNLGMILDETKKVEVLALFMSALCVFDPAAVLSKSVVDVREL